jgi:oligoribonuclease (3'-5' exoribonuclease)
MDIPLNIGSKRNIATNNQKKRKQVKSNLQDLRNIDVSSVRTIKFQTNVNLGLTPRKNGSHIEGEDLDNSIENLEI